MLLQRAPLFDFCLKMFSLCFFSRSVDIYCTDILGGFGFLPQAHQEDDDDFFDDAWLEAKTVKNKKQIDKLIA